MKVEFSGEYGLWKTTTVRACSRKGEGPRSSRDEVSTLRKKRRTIGELLKLGHNLLEKTV
jgi:hypothetical protein